MENKKIVVYILLFLSVLYPVLLLLNILNHNSFLESTWLFDPTSFNNNTWTPSIHKTFNIFIIWKKLKTFSFTSNINLLFVIYSLIFSIGNFLVINKFTNSKLNSALLTIFLCFSFISFFGLDLFLIQSFTLIPFILFSFLQLKNNSFLKIFLSLLLSILLCINSFSFSFLIFLFSIIAILLIDNKKINKTLFFTLLIPIFIFTLMYNLVPETDYPNSAKVVEDDGLPGHLRPLFANLSNIPFVNRVLERELSLIPSIFFLLLSSVLLVKKIIELKKIKLNSEFYFFVISLLIFGDIYLVEEFSSILPIATAKRLVPYFYHYPITPYLCFFLSILMLFKFTKNNDKISIHITLIALTTLCLIYNNPIFQDRENNELVKFSELKKYKDLNIINPSYALIRKVGFKAFKNEDKLKNLKIKTPNPHNIILSKNGFRIPAKKRWLFDKNKETRFRTKQQYGKEWIHLAFKKQKEINGIALQTGIYSSDFPRGIRIKSKENCEFNTVTDLSKLKDYKTVYEKKNWIGSYKFTGNGNLYLTAEGIINLIFDKKVNTQCLLIEQTGFSDYFDWSVAEVKLLN